jgi:flagellar motor component MotA
MEIPLEGVAAYWLSLKKVLKTKKLGKVVAEEAAYTSEPYIRHLLELMVSSFSETRIARLARIKQETISEDLQRKLIIISIGILGIAANENPQQVLVRIISKFPISPVVEKQTFARAQALLDRLSESRLVVDIDHRMDIETLISHLVFYCMLSRRKGREACRPLLQDVRSMYFCDGMTLIIDGFETEFIKYRLNLQKDEILSETRRKMNLALEMCLSLRNEDSYEDMFTLARSFMPQ